MNLELPQTARALCTLMHKCRWIYHVFEAIDYRYNNVGVHDPLAKNK